MMLMSSLSEREEQLGAARDQLAVQERSHAHEQVKAEKDKAKEQGRAGAAELPPSMDV